MKLNAMKFLGCFIFSLSESGFATEFSKRQLSHVVTPVEQSEFIATQAKRWRIDPEDYQRYLALMDGPLGKWNPSLDPLLALGMFAETESQQRRFAELYAQQEYELTERTLRFQHAYREAFTRLYPHAKLIDHQKLVPFFEHRQRKTKTKNIQRLARRQFLDGDHLLVFVTENCTGCVKQLHRLTDLLAHLDDTQINVYLRKVGNDKGVREWAKKQDIKADWLQRSRMTLNRDEGLYQRLSNQAIGKDGNTMAIYLRRAGQYFLINKEDLGL